MNFRITLFLSTLSLLLSCATTTPGISVKTENKDFSVSMLIDSAYSNNQIKMIRYSIKNKSKNWAIFEKIDMNASNNVEVLVGDKMNSWFEACGLKERVSEYNINVALGTVMLAGAAVAASGGAKGNSGQVGTGIALMGGSITASGIKSFIASKKEAEMQKAFPANHIFQPFMVPPGMVVQRWILIENPQAEKFSIVLKQKDKIDLVIE